MGASQMDWKTTGAWAAMPDYGNSWRRTLKVQWIASTPKPKKTSSSIVFLPLGAAREIFTFLM